MDSLCRLSGGPRGFDLRAKDGHVDLSAAAKAVSGLACEGGGGKSICKDVSKENRRKSVSCTAVVHCWAQGLDGGQGSAELMRGKGFWGAQGRPS